VSRQPPVQQPPPVQKLWLRYAKRGRGRFASHRDFARAFERALRRAGAPLAYSSGFTPHPRISWANSVPTGAESESEYVAIGLAAVVDPAELAAALNATLPPGFALLAARPAGANLMAELTHSAWEITFPVWENTLIAPAEESSNPEAADLAADPKTAAGTDRPAPDTAQADQPNLSPDPPLLDYRAAPSGLSPAWADRLTRAVAWFLAQPDVPVSRQTKRGRRQFDARGPVVSLTVEPSPDCPNRPGLRLVSRHTVPLVRPDDVVQALDGIDALDGIAPGLGADCLIRRTAQGRLVQGRVVDPLPGPPPA
jgi:hypothetical protein